MDNVRRLRQDDNHAVTQKIFDYVKENDITDLMAFFRGLTHFMEDTYPLVNQPHAYYIGYRFMRGVQPC